MLFRSLEITQSCARHMTANGIFQWNEHYPSLEAFQKDLDREELYVFEQEERVLGAVVISDFKDHVYEPIQWMCATGKNMYIHRLCVHPIAKAKDTLKNSWILQKIKQKKKDLFQYA